MTKRTKKIKKNKGLQLEVVNAGIDISYPQ
jgi:hypothetical protein